MKILIDIGHPAHVHYFKNFIKIIESKGGKCLAVAREKDIAIDLLEEEKIKYRKRGKGGDSVFSKIVYLIKADLEILKMAKEFDPDLFLSFGSPYLAHVAKIMRRPHIAFSDTEHNTLSHLMYRPFTELIFTPNAYKGDFKRQVRFNGYMELTYLAPNYFQPDSTVLDEIGLSPYEKFSILRFVSWNALHDIGHQGITREHKKNVVNELKKLGKVVISSEAKMPDELEQYRFKLNPAKMHSLMSYATILYGESATMASESAVLGVPAIYHDKTGRGYTDEQENKYGLVYNFTDTVEDQAKSLDQAIEIIRNNNHSKYRKRREKLLSDNIDVTAFMVWVVENWPQSKRKILSDPNCQERFR